MITALVGHRGVGKTTLLRRLELVFAGRDNIVFKDLDTEVENFERRSIANIFKESGEAQFRKMESTTFFRLVEQFGDRDQVFISVGAGFQFEIPKTVKVVWVRRVSDANGRVFLTRPALSERTPLEEWNVRFPSRDANYRKIADEQLIIPESSLHDSCLEEHFFGVTSRTVPYSFTVLPEHFRSADFFERRNSWNLKYLEMRDDLLTPAQVEHLRAAYPPSKLLYSIRKEAPKESLPQQLMVDWAVELGVAPPYARIVSLHERWPKLSDTLREFSNQKTAYLKAAPEVHSFSELLEGHQWWKKDPIRRSFLPRSSDGRWQWYRQLFGPSMPLHFFREGDGSSLDQPYLWQTLATPKWSGTFAAVLGSPVKHSWTPSFQREFFEPHGIPVVAIDLKEDEWGEAMPILQELGLKFAAVTSPLKKKAFESCTNFSPDARTFESVNTMAFTLGGWFGHNTDIVGAKTLIREGFADKALPVLVWGGGGTKLVLQEILPNAQFVSAREGRRLEEPVNMIWAVGRSRSFTWPEPAVFIQRLVDLNYSEDSPGREIAQRAGSPYKSGELMFIHQGYAQREFWKRFL